MRWVPPVTSLALLASCVSTSFPEGTFACDPTTAPACPSGLTCATDGRCRTSADAGRNEAGLADASADGSEGGTVLLGDSRTGATTDTVDPGFGVAFPFTAQESGQVGRLFVLLDPSNRAGAVEIGLYDEYFSHPGQRLAVATIQQATSGWNSVPVSPAAVAAGERYWLAIFSKTQGTEVAFDEDPLSGDVHGEHTIDGNQSALPGFWPSGAGFDRRPACVYATTF